MRLTWLIFPKAFTVASTHLVPKSLAVTSPLVRERNAEEGQHSISSSSKFSSTTSWTHAKPIAFPPAFLISATVSSVLFASRSLTTTLAPWEAKRRAVAWRRGKRRVSDDQESRSWSLRETHFSNPLTWTSDDGNFSFHELSGCERKEGGKWVDEVGRKRELATDWVDHWSDQWVERDVQPLWNWYFKS